MSYNFCKKNEKDVIWWVDDPETRGPLLFSFDKKKIFNFWTDYPKNLTKTQKEMFDRENPFWADF